jgi:lipopolysaccharide export system permease protein
MGVWMSDFVLLVVGALFLRQARADARLFEADFYLVAMDKLKRWFARKRQLRAQQA